MYKNIIKKESRMALFFDDVNFFIANVKKYGGETRGFPL